MTNENIKFTQDDVIVLGLAVSYYRQHCGDKVMLDELKRVEDKLIGYHNNRISSAAEAIRNNDDENPKLGFYFYGAGDDLHQDDKQHKPVTDEQKKEFIEMIEKLADEG